MHRGEAGAALLEAIVALFVLAVAGTAALTLARESIAAVEHARDADRRTAEASDFLEAVSLWTREDLDRRLGDRPQGPWRLVIDRPRPELYTVLLADSLHHPLLATALFRPDSARAQP